MRQKPQEGQGIHLTEVTTTNLPTTSPDQWSDTPSAYNEFPVIHGAGKKTDLPQAIDTLPSPASGLEIALARKTIISATHDVCRQRSGQL